MATNERVWLCDYDLAKYPTARRIQFYRLKARLIKEAREQNPSIRTLLGSMSVFLTNDESLARDASEIALEHAASSTHVYQLDSMQEIQEWPTQLAAKDADPTSLTAIISASASPVASEP